MSTLLRHRAAPDTRDVSRGGLYDVAPPGELLFSLSADGTRKYFHPEVRRGRFWHIRRRLAYALMLLFVALPLVPVRGHPAVLFDLATRQTHLFGATFQPTDNLVLAAFGFGVVVTAFFVGSTFGRMWCGFSCPQTVYLEFLFRPIETFFEGTPTTRRRLNQAPWSWRKAGVKTAKWVTWTAIAVPMATTFVAYFTGWSALAPGLLRHPAAWPGALFTIAFLSALILFDFGWFRDQMCTIACPYGRLQNVIADPDTLVVAYDVARGEPRTAPKRALPGVPGGDCIDCGACLAVCPTGTDIRRGLQVECIGTAQCVDACDEIMRKLGRPTGLIRFTSERAQKGGAQRLWRPRTLAYLALMACAWGTFGVLVFTRGDALVEVVRGAREPYRLLTTGEVANQQRIRVTNQLDEPQRFTVAVVAPSAATLVLSQTPIVTGPGEVVTINAVTTVPRRAFVDGEASVRYVITSDRGFRKELDFLLLGPYGQAGRTP